MAAKLDFLLKILENNEFRHLTGSLPKIKDTTFRNSALADESMRVYRELGGVLDQYPWNPPSWDLEFETFALKLDEAPNFNRYRALTLKSSLYTTLNNFPLENYKRYCRQHEPECLKSAKHLNMWSDRESEKYFGESQDPGDLALKGASKWKERAFFDFLEDATGSLSKTKVIRISIYDNLMINNKLIKLDALLISQNPQNEKYIWNYLSRKITPILN